MILTDHGQSPGDVLLSVMLDAETVAVLYAPPSVERPRQAFVPDGAQLFIGAINTDIEPTDFRLKTRPRKPRQFWKETLFTDRGTLVIDEERFPEVPEIDAKPVARLGVSWRATGSMDVIHTAALHEKALDYQPSGRGTMMVMAVERRVLFFGRTYDDKTVVCALGPTGMDTPYAAAEFYVGDLASNYATRVVLRVIEHFILNDELAIPEYVGDPVMEAWWCRLVDADDRSFVQVNEVEEVIWYDQQIKQLDAAHVTGIDPNAGTVHFHLS